MGLRIVAAVAVLVSAVVHLEQWILVFRNSEVIGPAMLANFVGGVVIAVWLLIWRRHWLPWLLVIVFGVSTLGAFLTSATVGLFGVHEHWTIWEVYVAAGVEVIAIIVGIVGLALQLRRRPLPS